MLILRGSSTYLYSKEGVLQGNPLSKFIYAIGTLPLILSLNNPGQLTQCGMLNRLLPVKLCHSCAIGSISFICMVPGLVIILNL